MKYTNKDLIESVELVSNCITSCNTATQLDIAEKMIAIFITDRFKKVTNHIELLMFEDYLYGAIEMQKVELENRFNYAMEYPTFQRNMN